MKKLLVFLLLLSLLIGLAVSSSQTYEQQSLVTTLEQFLPGEPGKNLLAKLEFSYWDRPITVEERGYYHFVEFLIRKSAHFLTFGFLALIIYWLLPKRKGRLVGAALITLILACADELHQSFTGGRTATIQDVYLDMTGAIVFLLFAGAAQLIHSIRRT
ncbi:MULTISPECIES: VanZ family protein [unclassified Sporosarcina]|uniref:VanZ family protein n=1 Tax=unclassified Sporosarcina TaxID=2647733 RepID=UPI00203F8DEA|nr:MULTISPECIES: VanZ family protein [unclassified Sporosarcina]GKV66067.1 membrane protein [Sporosarcina sp. NCCP-2331]GLB56174.1 membrane protein [Sporosarcina sp. NCCP-2378]